MSELFTKIDKLKPALDKLFQQHRLVFWYDEGADMRALFEHLALSDVEKVVIDNNEFALKYRLLKEQPKQKFLVYQAKERPADAHNWLLDLVLSHHEFHTDMSSLQLQDLDLPLEFKPLVKEHEKFFNSEKRAHAFKALLEPEDRESKLQLKMLSVVCGCAAEWEKVLYALFAEALKDKHDKYKDIEQFVLRGFLWETIGRKYNYKAANPTIKDFLLQLIQDNFERTLPDGKPRLNKDAYLFVNRWKENTTATHVFSAWSQQLERDLNIEALITPLSIEALLNADTYSIIDKKIIARINGFIQQNTVPNHTLQEWIERRKVKFFYADYQQLYEALSSAASLLDEIRKADLSMDSPKAGFDKYEKQWYKIDLLYRKYIFNSEIAAHQNVLKDLTKQVEKAYSNAFLLKLGDNWQSITEGMSNWHIDNIYPQRHFYKEWVAPYTKRENSRVFVIISDALRYESAVELRELILKEERYTAELRPVLGSLPSYTQLGMASLLPHNSLTFNEISDTVFADGINSRGTANRTKILQKEYAGSIAISAEDFLAKHAKNEGRDFIKPYKVVYIYSNLIDKTGDDKISEHKVFEATEKEFEHLLKIIRHVNNMNGYNMIITADHGYLYQHNRLEESDFTDFTAKGTVYRNTRRFILGKNLVDNAAVQKWTGKALGFGDDTEAQIPKSINRLRIQGAGSRFVHGGSSLQEIVIPVLEINKARKDDIGQVEIDLIGGSSNITSNTFGVNFYQKQAVSEKIQSRTIKAGFYTEGGKLVSDQINLLFNSPDKDAMSREKRQVFLFTSDAVKYNGQDIYLKLEEQIAGTHQFKTYRSITYRMLIAFSSDFDDF
jgi:uncharacterized protein (TIGR02687 family)